MSGQGWSRNMLNSLIAAVKDRPMIWQFDYPDRNKYEIDKQWKEIEKLLSVKYGDNEGCDAETMKKKWRNIKDQYRKDLRKVIHSKEAGGRIYKPPWCYYKTLSFLEETFINSINQNLSYPLPAARSTKKKRNKVPSENSDNIDDMEYFEDTVKSSQSNDDEGETVTGDDDTQFVDIGHGITFEPKENPEKSEDYYFLMSLLPHLERFTNPMQKFTLRNKINKVIMEEMQDMGEDVKAFC